MVYHKKLCPKSYLLSNTFANDITTRFCGSFFYVNDLYAFENSEGLKAVKVALSPIKKIVLFALMQAL